ncbi:MAG: 3-deoxy-7-phosphoheptulonate synthase, partial [Saccharolobus sp.]
MILYILRDKYNYSTLKEKLNQASASFKILNLYGKTLILAWPDQNVKNIRDESIEMAVEVKKPYILSSNEWKKEP